MSDRIPEYAREVRNIISSQLRGRFWCLKIDGTTKFRRSFLGINAQFVADGRIVVRTLAVKELFTSHTAVNIRNEVADTLKTYSLPVTTILTSTSDTGANMIKTAELLGDAQAEAAGSELLTEDVWFPECELTASDFRLQTVKCAAHVLQLAVGDAIQTANVREDLNAVRGLAKALRTPSLSRTLKKEGKSAPVLDVETRWGSTYDMLASVRSLKDFTEEMDEDFKPRLSASDWARIDLIIESLKPAREATTQLQENQLLLGDLYGIWLKCKMRTEKVDSDLARAIVRGMAQRERARVNKKGDETLPPLFEYPGFTAAIFMDPRYISILDESEVVTAKAYLLKLWARMQPSTPTSQTPGEMDTTSADASRTDADFDCDVDEYLRAKNEERSRHLEAPEMGIRAKLDYYEKNTPCLPRKADVLEYWEQQRILSPELYQLATTVLGIPSTQVSVETLFSTLAFIFSPLRANLRPEMLDDLLVMNSNADIVNQYFSTINPTLEGTGSSPSPGSSTSGEANTTSFSLSFSMDSSMESRAD